MILKRRFAIILSLFGFILIGSAIPYLDSFDVVWFYIPFLMIPFIFFKNEKAPNLRLNNSSFSLFLIWIVAFVIRAYWLYSNDFSYPLNPNVFILNLAYLGWLTSAELISRKERLWPFILSFELLLNILFLQRSFVALFVLALLFAWRTRISFKQIFFSVIALVIAFISIIYVRTARVSKDVDFSGNELLNVIRSGLERPSFYLRTDGKIWEYSQERDLSSLNDFSMPHLKWAFIPRFFQPEKPNLQPGVLINKYFWSDDSRINPESALPVGFAGNDLLYGKSFFPLFYVLHISILTFLFFLVVRFEHFYSWIGYFFIFTQFFIPEHAVFYLTAWLRILPAFLFIGWIHIKQKKKEKRVLVYSDSVEFGGIQRIVSLIKENWTQNGIPFKNLTYRPRSLFSRFSFTLHYFFLSLNHRVFISTHIHFNLLFRVRFFDTKLLSMAHGIEFDSHKAHSVKAVSDVILCNSKQTAKKVNLPEKTEVLPYPFLYVGKEEKLRSKTPLFVTVGRLSKHDLYKGYNDVLEGFTHFNQQNRQSELKIIGKGELLNDLQKKYQQSAGIQFAGFLDDDELKKLYQKAWAFILLSDKEGQGLTFFEAMSAGTPVIGLRNSVLQEFIQHLEQGILLDAPGDLSDSLQQLVDNPDLREKLSLKAFDYAENVRKESLFFSKIEKYIA